MTRPQQVAALIEEHAPDAVAHLAAVAFARDARVDAAGALRTTVGGTVNLLEAVRRRSPAPAMLVTGSSEVYGPPAAEDLPLGEGSTLHPTGPYALTKVAQEGVTLAFAARHGLRAVVTRSFNHAGPGQREVFVVPALARRVLAVQQGQRAEIPVGNVDVRRDFSDVRDVVRAYRLLLEASVDGRLPPGGAIYNVCSGRSVAIRQLLEELCELAGVEPRISVERELVRPDEPAEVRGSAEALREATGWRPEIPIAATLRDVWADVSAQRPAAEC